MESAFAKPRLATLLDHFSAIEDPSVSWRDGSPHMIVATTLPRAP